MFSELKSKPKPCKEILENENYDVVSVKANENKLYINLKILEIQDLPKINTLDTIISVLKMIILFQKHLFVI